MVDGEVLGAIYGLPPPASGSATWPGADGRSPALITEELADLAARAAGRWGRLLRRGSPGDAEGLTVIEVNGTPSGKGIFEALGVDVTEAIAGQCSSCKIVIYVAAKIRLMFTILTGAQFGDEGKGKVIDLLAENYDVVVRFQGGDNAGHTVVVGGKKYKLHLVPSGAIFGRRLLIGPGVVLNPRVLWSEIQALESRGHQGRYRHRCQDDHHHALSHRAGWAA